jgi:GNAT superfamily N-acetyltransferase
MLNLLNRFHDKVRLLGLKDTLRITPGWLLRPQYLVLCRDLTNTLPSVPEIPGLAWSQLQKKDMKQLLEIDPGLSLKQLQIRLDEGQECLLCRMSNNLVHFRWRIIRDTRLPYLDKDFRLATGDILDDLAFTHPDYRRLGINTASFVHGLQDARQQGFRRTVTLVAVWNRHVWQFSTNRLGFKPAGVAGFWNLGVTKLHFSKGDLHLHPKRGYFLPLN